jgi:Glu-tRNA(Gln) amidotransferase subunit E-like FAD-binding protein
MDISLFCDMKDASENAGEEAMDIVDVTIHVDQSVDHDRRTQIADTVRAHKGVAGVAHHDEKPHLMIVEYDPAVVDSQILLKIVLDQGVHAELVGL